MKNGKRKRSTMSSTLKLFIESIVGKGTCLDKESVSADLGTRPRSAEGEIDREDNTDNVHRQFGGRKKPPHSA